MMTKIQKRRLLKAAGRRVRRTDRQARAWTAAQNTSRESAMQGRQP